MVLGGHEFATGICDSGLGAQIGEIGQIGYIVTVKSSGLAGA